MKDRRIYIVQCMYIYISITQRNSLERRAGVVAVADDHDLGAKLKEVVVTGIKNKNKRRMRQCTNVYIRLESRNTIYIKTLQRLRSSRLALSVRFTTPSRAHIQRVVSAAKTFFFIRRREIKKFTYENSELFFRFSGFFFAASERVRKTRKETTVDGLQ